MLKKDLKNKRFTPRVNNLNVERLEELEEEYKKKGMSSIKKNTLVNIAIEQLHKKEIDR